MPRKFPEQTSGANFRGGSRCPKQETPKGAAKFGGGNGKAESLRRKQGLLSTIEVKSNLEEEIKTEQANDPGMNRIKAKIPQGKAKEFSLDNQGVLRYGNRLCVPRQGRAKTKNPPRSPQVCLFHPPRKYQDVPRFETNILSESSPRN